MNSQKGISVVGTIKKDVSEKVHKNSITGKVMKLSK